MQPNTHQTAVAEESSVEDRSCSMWVAQLAVLLAVPLVVVLAIPHVVLHGWPSLQVGLGLLRQWWLLLPVGVVGVVVHELLHGLTWAWLSNRPLRDLLFGFQLRSFTPFAHVKGPIPVGAYRVGTAMPGLVLGVVPALLGALLGAPLVTAMGLLFTLVACGDLLVLWMIRDVPNDRLVLDHPTRAGCYVFRASPGETA